ncbi:aminodeoxychorismate synthase component I [Terrimonas sp.]|uniref:anthranilate synthase component I family protein n=1 Tax=Terrimonas sp. TaxID=1914338 RepID=UPI000D51DEBF|nr:anthranilate synthase component I family protein [Terrimonas sp.]PVD49568.1 aminodeoxychorismate synthase component I [Terrimonas sp.]
MKRTFRSFSIQDFIKTKMQMLYWANQFNICCFLDDHQYKMPGHTFECILAVNSIADVKANAGNAFQQLDLFLRQNDDWCFGHLGYDLKNELENLHSKNADYIQFPDLFFFVPETVVILKESELVIGVCGDNHLAIASAITGKPVGNVKRNTKAPVKVNSRFSKKDYIQTIAAIKEHILRGDCYELNFCQEFYIDIIDTDPLDLYMSLSKESPNPFSSYYKLNDKYLLCASPERYIKKTGTAIMSQPIKGTTRRNIVDDKVDFEHKIALQNSSKDRSENIMVVDLVRNDLSKICREGSVKVSELFGIYAFPQVYQMISTISGEIGADVSVTDIFSATFPMGSMTGAPKKRVMELIDEYEKTKRGVFSGAVGYISPERNMDFNVVIRSMLYNATSRYLSFQTGSAITYYCNAESEYEECLLKAAAIKKVLNQ